MKEQATRESQKLHDLSSHDESIQGSAIILKNEKASEEKKKVYIETYGCQMNFNDSEIVASVLANEDYVTTDNHLDADLVFLNTCSIREKAETTIRKRLIQLKHVKRPKNKKHVKVGILGCMAERLKSQLLEEEDLVDMVIGPDAYRSIPDLISETKTGQKAVNVFLSKDETYEEIEPKRYNTNGISAFVTITRGCDNMCAFCVVPFTRGRERSRNAFAIIAEAQELYDTGYKEVTLLGQNVDSYGWDNPENKNHVSFANLLEMTAQIAPDLRVRFSTSHPKDITDQVLYTIAKYPNICNYIHLPIQSGNTRILDLMNRTYTREWYIDRIEAIRKIIPECAISTDIITGFCSETEEEHKDTLTMMDYVKYDVVYNFKYSERPGTLAEKKLEDNVPEEIKARRLTEVVENNHKHALTKNQAFIGKTVEVLVEGTSKKSTEKLFGREDQNKVVIFDRKHLTDAVKGTFVKVKIDNCSSATLFGELIKTNS